MTGNKRTRAQAKPPKAKPAKPKPSARHKDEAVADLPFGAEPFIPSIADDASLHDLFQRQTMEMLDRSDLSEEQKQNVLVAMNCPCCGGSGLSFTIKLKRKS